MKHNIYIKIAVCLIQMSTIERTDECNVYVLYMVCDYLDTIVVFQDYIFLTNYFRPGKEISILHMWRYSNISCYVYIPSLLHFYLPWHS
jgi:hypothetical protein